MRRFVALSVAFVACLPAPEVDLEGPRVVGSTLGPFAVQVPVVPDIEIELSEAPDPATVHAGSVALVRWGEVGRCDLTPVCAKGSCAAGRCWKDPLSSSDLSALDRGEYVGESEDLVETEIELDEHRLRVTPSGTLEAHARYSLVLGEGVRDGSGAGLEDEAGLRARWRSDFVTAGEGSAGPTPRLWFPGAGATQVPTNLVRVETRFGLPVEIAADATLRLGDDDREIGLTQPAACTGWVPGFCATWTIDGELPRETSLHLLGGSLEDALGRGVVLPFAEESFRTGAGPDLEAPVLDGVDVSVRGPCVVARLEAAEPLRVSLALGDDVAELAAAGEGVVVVALRVPDELETSTARVEAVDLAGNAAAVEIGLDEAALDAERPALAITELLANPSGPEPHQEFVELANLGTEPIELEGLWLSDLAWEEVDAVLQAGSKTPGDALPAATLGAGELAVVVAAGYDPLEGSDEAPAAGARILHVDASVAQGGLKNAGEPLTLYRADPPALVSSYGNFVDTSASDHGGRSVSIVRPDACDVASSWASHPLGRATPGRLP